MKFAIALVLSGLAAAQSFDANGGNSTVGGGADLGGCGPCTTGQNAQNLGGPNGGTLTIKNVNVPKDGVYTLTITYDNARPFNLDGAVSPNGGAGATVSMPSTGSWYSSSTAKVQVTLKAGDNTLHFGSLTDTSSPVYRDYGNGSGNWVGEITDVTVTPAPAGTAASPAVNLARNDSSGARGAVGAVGARGGRLPNGEPLMNADGSPVTSSQLMNPGPAQSILAANGQAPAVPAGAIPFSGGDLQGAINAAAGKAIEVKPGTYSTGPIRMPTNTILYLDAGATIQASGPGAFPTDTSEVFRIEGVSGVSILGVPGQSVILGAGWGQSGEWRHCIGIHGSRDVLINGIQCNGSGGDGLYVADGSTGVSVANSTFDKNKRNGLSVISVNGMTINNCVFSNTNGTLPKAGVDFEPNNAGDTISNVLMENSSSINNGGDCVMFSNGFRGGANSGTSITVRNYTCTGNAKNRIFAWGGGSGGGNILLENVNAPLVKDSWGGGDPQLVAQAQ